MKHVFPAFLMLFISNTALAADLGSLNPPMVRITSGSFDMGSKIDGSETPVHKVNIGYAFELGKTEVTQAQWQAVMGDKSASFSKCEGNCPVEKVSWSDAMLFISKLNKLTGKQYRLPSEAEWEYACRAGGNDKYCGGSDAGKVAWYKDNSGGEIKAAAKKKPNAWGLYDMSGNVWEWVADSYHETYAGAPADGSAWIDNSANKVVRGGSWGVNTNFLRATIRLYDTPDDRFSGGGFRLARSLP